MHKAEAELEQLRRGARPPLIPFRLEAVPARLDGVREAERLRPVHAPSPPAGNGRLDSEIRRAGAGAGRPLVLLDLGDHHRAGRGIPSGRRDASGAAWDWLDEDELARLDFVGHVSLLCRQICNHGRLALVALVPQRPVALGSRFTRCKPTELARRHSARLRLLGEEQPALGCDSAWCKERQALEDRKPPPSSLLRGEGGVPRAHLDGDKRERARNGRSGDAVRISRRGLRPDGGEEVLRGAGELLAPDARNYIRDVLVEGDVREGLRRRLHGRRGKHATVYLHHRVHKVVPHIPSKLAATPLDERLVWVLAVRVERDELRVAEAVRLAVDDLEHDKGPPWLVGEKGPVQAAE
mmetsp:Transcript_18816/g.57047  ORF Transcript_18816/g.57047 Transcript_18816/m.57047 type:complete len:353 (+) Transcript_18816:548-1606(+)